MIRGMVTDRRATLNLTLQLPNQPNLALEFEIDTAFRGALAIPPDAVAALKLPFLMETRTLPASGVPLQANLHRVDILWDNQTLAVTVLALGLRPLIGTILLENHRLQIAYTENGEVLIEPLEAP